MLIWVTFWPYVQCFLEVPPLASFLQRHLKNTPLSVIQKVEYLSRLAKYIFFYPIIL